MRVLLLGLALALACGAQSETLAHAPRDAGRVDGDASSGVPTTFGARGGAVSALSFVVVGDTRPANVDDTAAYPFAIARKIFEDVQSLDPVPPFGVSTGDYVFASPRGAQAAPQLDLYLRARSAFSGLMFPAMGNHECTGATTSNCGPSGADGTTDNYSQFLAKLLLPLGQSSPYYDVRVDSETRDWTAKFVFVAANAWSGDQAKWLDAALAQPTTYTFVVRHEPAAATAAPGVVPSEQIMSRHPLTLAVVGHSHTYAKSGPREVLFGNGGAPLTSSAKNYGFGWLRRRHDGAIQVDALDYDTLARDASFEFAINADGTPAPP